MTRSLFVCSEISFINVNILIQRCQNCIAAENKKNTNDKVKAVDNRKIKYYIYLISKSFNNVSI